MPVNPSVRRFHTPLVTIGSFALPPDDPRFATAGQVAEPEFVFPRSAVWIEHQDRAPFLADPGVATLYNGGTPYLRHAASAEGDRCDWFRVDRATLRDIACGADPAVAEHDRPFGAPWVRVSPRTYARQRALLDRLARGALTAVAVEAEALAIACELLRLPAGSADRSTRNCRGGVIDAARAVLRDPGHDWTLTELAAIAALSPFQLLRGFKSWTGLPVHAWLLDLRLRLSLERVAAGEDLSRVAVDLGFASHSHFTTAFGRAFGLTPSAFRQRARAADCRISKARLGASV